MAILNSSGKNSYSKVNNDIASYLSGICKWQEMEKSAQEEVIKSLLTKVKIIAYKIKNKLPSNIDLDDLISAGSLGLIEGLANFDPSRDVKLDTFVENRIRGAMLDELRRQDWLSRGFRKNIKLVEIARQSLERKLGREPRIDELVKETGLKRKEVENCLEVINNNLLISLDVINYLHNHSDQENNPYLLLEKKELIARLSKFIKELTEKEQLVLSLYYVEELTMKEVAEVLEISEGRVSQLHTQAIKKLKNKMKNIEG